MTQMYMKSEMGITVVNLQSEINHRHTWQHDDSHKHEVE